MEPIEELTHVMKNVVVPQLTALASGVRELSADVHKIMLGQERHRSKIASLEEKIKCLPCVENTNIMRGHGSRIAKLEERADQGHQQDTECRDKNKLVGEALHLAKKNRDKNKEQESRYRAVIHWLWWIFGGILTLIGATYYTKHIM